MSDLCTPRICGVLLRDSHEAMQVLKVFYDFKYKCKCEQRRIFIFRCAFLGSQDASFSWVARKQKRSFAPCHTIVRLHRESFGADGKDDCNSTEAESFQNRDAFSGSGLLEIQDTTLWGVKAHQHSTNLQSWSSVPRQQGE